MKCQTTASWKDKDGFEHYHLCHHKPAYEATYKGIRGEFETKVFCKKHFNALVKNSERLKTKIKYDIQLTFTEITPK